jgi:ribosomal silencing factor RsfS
MVEQRVLDDFKSGDWIGINYQEPEKPFYDFPAIAKSISNRNNKSIDDCVEIEIAPKGCPVQLKREYISRIWKIGEVHS